MTWLVTVDYRGYSGAAMLADDDTRLAACTQLLADHMGEATTDGSVYSVAVMVDSTTPGSALETAEALVVPALERAHLPVWRRVRVEVIEEDEVRRSRVK